MIPGDREASRGHCRWSGRVLRRRRGPYGAAHRATQLGPVKWARYHPAARDELRAAIRYGEGDRPGRGALLEAAVSHVLRRLWRLPPSAPRWPRIESPLEIRRARVKRHPYERRSDRADPNLEPVYHLLALRIGFEIVRCLRRPRSSHMMIVADCSLTVDGMITAPSSSCGRSSAGPYQSTSPASVCAN